MMCFRWIETIWWIPDFVEVTNEKHSSSNMMSTKENNEDADESDDELHNEIFVELSVTILKMVPSMNLKQ